MVRLKVTPGAPRPETASRPPTEVGGRVLRLPGPTRRAARHFDRIRIVERKEAVAALAALAHETRIEAFRRLVQAGPDGLAAGVLSEALAVPAPTLSFHLKELRQAGLVTSDRRGRQVIYRASYPAMDELLTFLTERCCAGGPEGAPRPEEVRA